MINGSVVILASLVFWSCTSKNSRSAENRFGEVEVDEIDVASRLPGRIKKILVHPGQKVKVGDLLVEFEDDLMAIKRAGAQAVIAAAESKRNLAEDAVRPEEKEQLAAAMIVAKKQLGFAKATLNRSKILLKEGAISQQNFDEIEFRYQAAQEGLNAAEAKVRMAEIGARPEERAGAQALVDQAGSVLSEVEAYQKDMNLTAAVDGEVAKIISHEGELVPTGFPIVTLIKIDEPWVSLSVPESILADYSMDKEFKVSLPALDPKTFVGKVSYIAAMANFATKTFTQDKSSFDLKTFEVQLRLQGDLSGIRPGMTALVKK